ncbi:MAG: hypothetical protein ACRDHN_20370, partial [Thermomicrobiales bacterium]
MSSGEEEFLNAVRQNDVKANVECNPPLGERLHIPTIFLAEVFPSSLTGSLKGTLRRRKWTGESKQILPGNDAVSWLDGAIDAISSTSWINVGTIRKVHTYQEDDAVPGCAKAIIVTIEQMVPGMIVVTSQFILEDSISGDLNELLEEPYSSELEQRGIDRFVALEPAKVKAREFNQSIDRIRTECAKWMRSFVSGTFAATGDLAAYPFCVLMAFEKEGRLDGPERFRISSYYSAVGFESPSSAQRNEELKLFLAGRDRSKQTTNLVLVGNRHSLLNQPGDDWWQYCHRLNLQFNWNFSRWALHSYLLAAMKEIGSIRVDLA